MKLYVVFYEIVGSRCNGTYLVHTSNAKKACSIVRDIDDDYVCRSGAELVGEYREVAAWDDDAIVTNEWCLELDDVKEVKEPNSYYQLECGT